MCLIPLKSHKQSYIFEGYEDPLFDTYCCCVMFCDFLMDSGPLESGKIIWCHYHVKYTFFTGRYNFKSSCLKIDTINPILQAYNSSSLLDKSLYIYFYMVMKSLDFKKTKVFWMQPSILYGIQLTLHKCRGFTDVLISFYLHPHPIFFISVVWVDEYWDVLSHITYPVLQTLVFFIICCNSYAKKT